MGNIIINTSLRDKYSTGFTRAYPPSEIILHGTGGGDNAKALIRWMESGERQEEYKKGIALFHYLIDYNGNVYNIIDSDRWVYHSSSGLHDMNTIGIEMMNKDMNNKSSYTLSQYQSLSDLLFLLLVTYPIEIIQGHGVTKLKYSGKYKNCPGNFDWELLNTTLTEKNYKYKYTKERIELYG